MTPDTMIGADDPTTQDSSSRTTTTTTTCSCCTTARREVGFTVCDFMHDFLPRGTADGTTSPDVGHGHVLQQEHMFRTTEREREPAGQRTTTTTMMHVMNTDHDNNNGTSSSEEDPNRSMSMTTPADNNDDISLVDFSTTPDTEYDNASLLWTTSTNNANNNNNNTTANENVTPSAYSSTSSISPRDECESSSMDDDDEQQAITPPPSPHRHDNPILSSNVNGNGNTRISTTTTPVQMQGRRLDSDTTLIYSHAEHIDMLSAQRQRQRQRLRYDGNGEQQYEQFSSFHSDTDAHHHRVEQQYMPVVPRTPALTVPARNRAVWKWKWTWTWEVKVAAATFLVYIVSISIAFFVLNKGSADEVLIGSLLDKIKNLQRQLRAERVELVKFQQEQNEQLSSQRHRCTALMRQAAAEPPGSSFAADQHQLMEPGVCAPELGVTYHAEFHNMGTQLDEWTPIQLVDQLSQFTGINMVIPPKCSYSYVGVSKREDVGLKIQESFSCIVFLGAPDSGHMLLNAHPSRKYLDMEMKICLQHESDNISSLGSKLAVVLHELFNPPLYANSPVEIFWSIRFRQQRGNMSELQGVLSSMKFPWKRLVYSGESAGGQSLEVWDLFDRLSTLQDYQSFLNTIATKDHSKIPHHILPDRSIFVDGVFRGSLEKYAACTELFVHSALVSHPKPSRIAFVGDFFPGVVREALKHPPLESITIVLPNDERNMLNTSREYLPDLVDCRTINGSASDCFQDERVSMKVHDPVSWVQHQVSSLQDNMCNVDDDGGGSQILSCEQPQVFDVIFMDMQQIHSEVVSLPSLIRSLKLVVGSDGIVVFDIGRSPRKNSGISDETATLDSLIDALTEHQFAWWIIEESSW